MTEQIDKYHQAIAASKVTTDDAFVAAEVKRILDEHLKENMTQDVYRFLFNTIDLTTLKATDSQRSVAAFTERVNAFEAEHPELKTLQRYVYIPILRRWYAPSSMSARLTSRASAAISPLHRASSRLRLPRRLSP